MRRHTIYKFLTIFIGALIIAGLTVSPAILKAQNLAMKRTDYKALAEEGYKNAKQTKDIVAGVIKKLDASLKDASELKKHEVADAKFWFKKADDLLMACKKKMDAGKYDKQLVIDLNQSWQWFIKAGSAAVRASMME